MPSYVVSFDLASNSTYGDRYRSLMEQIRKAPSTSAWTETTSFALVATTETLATFADRLYFSSSVNAITDKLLVFNPATSEAVVRGPIQYPATLGGHFRSCLKK